MRPEIMKVIVQRPSLDQKLAGLQLKLPADGPKGTWPPYLEVGGVRVYLITVRALPVPTASQQGKLRPVSVTREDLVNPDA